MGKITHRESRFGVLHLKVGHLLFCFCLEHINPTISDAIRKLFFLSPKNFFWKIWVFLKLEFIFAACFEWKEMVLLTLSSNAFRIRCFSILSPHIFDSGSRDIAYSINSLSRKGTLASTPHAMVDLFALRQSNL